ncbi:MAG TPA: ABC transporter substrate-binding protein, partial [Candidatus Tectomicrobia bacterium]
MTRRTVGWLILLAWGMVCAPLAVAAPPGERVWRIGFLAFGPPPPDPVPPAFPLTALREGLRELGYVEGHTVIVEERWAAGDLARLPALAAELVQLPVNIIVASGASAVRAARDATRSIPIVIAGAADPVAEGLVTSLAHPGGNVTGLAVLAGRDVEGKRLELLQAAVPTATRVGVVLDSTSRLDATPVREAARALGLTLLFSAETATPDEFQSAFAAMITNGADALYAPETPVNARHRDLIVELAARHRLPAMYASRDFVDAGGLMAYGVENLEVYRRAAVYLDKILKGAKPADLPIEQPTRFELVISLKTAKALGLTIPQSLL